MGGYGHSRHGYSGYGYYGNGVAGAPITPREASTAMALVTLHAEKNVEIMAFADRFMPVNFSRRQRLDDACRLTQGMPFMGTDCSIPMTWAESKAKEFDAFIVYTDSETWAGKIHPKQALDSYRQRTGINSKSVVVGMVSNGFTIADPNDPGMMDVVGFDTSAPALMTEFVADRL
jgi:60 kDa SS-A/Ro ribonucleoprotein